MAKRWGWWPDGLGELAVAGAVEPGRGGGGSPESKKMVEGEFAGAREDGGGVERGRADEP